MKKLLKGLNEASKLMLKDAREKGFYLDPMETGTLLMLVVTELSEALEAERRGKYADVNVYKACELADDISKKDMPIYLNTEFARNIKDTHEDEIADAIIRLLNYSAYKGIDIEWHILKKLEYNKSRPYKFGKSY